MRFLVWCEGVLVCLVGVQLSFMNRDGWRWVWFVLLGVWFFAGLALAVARVAKLVAGKVGTGGLGLHERAKGQAAGPTIHKD